MQRIKVSRRPRSRNELASWYAEALDEQAASGLSVSEYAGQLGVTPATLYQWRRRLSGEDSGEFGTAGSVGLVEVTLEGNSSGISTRPFVVRLGHGRSVEVPPRFDDTALMKIVATLESC